MTALSTSERLANAIWREISNPARIFTKGQIQHALQGNGIYRSQATLFGNTVIRRILESKAASKNLALVIDRGCVFVTTEEWEILHKTVRQLRYAATFGESIGHEGRGIDKLLASADPISRAMGRLAITTGTNGALLRRELESAESALATTFEAGRAAANAHFAAARNRALTR